MGVHETRSQFVMFRTVEQYMVVATPALATVAGQRPGCPEASVGVLATDQRCLLDWLLLPSRS